MGNSTDDSSGIAILRLTLDELFTDHRFFIRQSMTAGQVADFILSLVQKGERDPDRLKALAFEKFSCTPPGRFVSNDSGPAEKCHG
jgi:hypothetical protein